MDLYKKTLLKYLKKTMKNRLIIHDLRTFLFQNIVYNILLDETFGMRGHSLLSNSVKFIKIWIE